LSEKSYGLSIDGDRVNIVEMLGDVVVSCTPVAAGSLADSLRAALAAVKQRRNDPPVRVALVAPSATLRRIDVTAKTASSRAEFEDAAHAALPVNRETSSFAGAFFEPEAMLGDAVTPGVAVIAPKPLVEEVYAVLDKVRAEVVASPLTLTGPDGVWIGLHQSLAEVTLLENSRPVAYRQLRIGGLASLLNVLGDPSSPGLALQRLLGSLTGTGPDDPGARIEVSRYMRMLTGEVGQTLEYWRRSGENVPAAPHVVLYGLGACSAAASTALAEAGLAAGLPEEITQRLGYVSLAQRPEAVLGFSAAVTAGRFMPQAAFVNPVLSKVVDARRRARRRLTVAGLAATVVLLAGIFVGRPVYSGWSAKRDADRELAAARTEFTDLAGVYAQTVDLDARTAIIRAERSREPGWSGIFRDVLATVPAGAQVGQLTTELVDPATGVVEASLSVTMTKGGYQDLVDWLERLAALDGATDTWSSGFSQEGGGASFVVSVRLTRPSTAETGSPAPTTTVAPAPDMTEDTTLDDTDNTDNTANTTTDSTGTPTDEASPSSTTSSTTPPARGEVKP
jgi:Tfp pilus assembly protein PilN